MFRAKQAVWKNNQRVAVRGGIAVFVRGRGAVHLQHMQTHLPEASAQRRQVPGHDLRYARGGAHADHTLQLRGDCAVRTRGACKPPDLQFVPIKGELCFLCFLLHPPPSPPPPLQRAAFCV